MKVSIVFTDHSFDWFVDRLEGIEYRGERDVLARCPAHDDGRPSLHVLEDEQGLLVHCFAGCSRGDVEEALEDASPSPREQITVRRVRKAPGRIVARYVYTDETGEPVIRKLRYEPKSFRLQRATRPAWWEGVRWVTGLKSNTGELLVPLVPYRLPDVLAAATRGAPVYVVDGEKDADRLAAEGVAATCSPYGMARWRPEFSEYLSGVEVVVIADRDEPGYRAATKLAEGLGVVAASVRIAEAQEGKDAFDHLEAGYSLDEFSEVLDAD